jgi:hypothetical protein
MFSGENICGLYSVRLFSLICDLPARALALNKVGHTGYFCCISCFINGDYSTKVFFPFCKTFVKRDQRTYRECLKLVSTTHKKNNFVYGIKGRTELSNYIDVLQDSLYDFMHLCCEGYVKRFLTLITQSSNHRCEYYLGIY